MPKAFLFNLFIVAFLPATAQKISVANERFNIFYTGVNNPLAIAAENVSSKHLVVKASTGTISKKDGNYFFTADSVGITDIILYAQKAGRIKEIGRSTFRIKALPTPVFKIGSGKKKVSNKEIAAQEFVRAEQENIDIDISYKIKSFTVIIIGEDTCAIKKLHNEGNKISDAIRLAFANLKNADSLLFKDIFIIEPFGNERQLENIFIHIEAKR